jgi:tRNA G18 (ribose-2'-O)-methylase SpoU
LNLSPPNAPITLSHPHPQSSLAATALDRHDPGVATLRIQPVTDLADPVLKPYRTLRRRKDLERQRVFVVEGDKVVQRLLESHFPVQSLLITAPWLERVRELLDRRADQITVFLAEKAQIEEITGFGCYQGIKAVGHIDRPATLSEMLQSGPRPRLFAAFDGVSNAENLGVMVRNCAALGAHAVIIGETSASPFLTRAIRTSMGAIFRLPAIEVLDLVKALETLRAEGVRCVAAHPSSSGNTLAATDLTGDVCIVLGSEGHGLRADVLAACDEGIAVPMAAGVDSLNVSSATAVFLYEAARQRGLTVRTSFV